MKFIVNQDFMYMNNYYSLDIIRSAYVKIDKTWQEENTTSPFSKLYFVKEGEGYLTYNNKTIKLEAGNIYLIPAGLTYSYGRAEGSIIKKLYFHFNYLESDGVDLFSKMSEIFQIKSSKELIDKLIKDYRSENMASMFNVNSFIYEILARFINSSPISAEKLIRHSPKVEKAMIYIKDNLSAKLTVKEVASNLFFSKTSLNEAFKKELGKGVGDYIDDLLFIQVQKMLNETDWTVGEISNYFKFCDQFYLSRRFKQKVGVSPKEYRASLNNASKF